MGPRHTLRLLLWIVAYDCSDSGGNRPRNEPVPIARLTPHGNENIPRLHSARVVFNTGHLRIAAVGNQFRASEEFEESHWVEYIATW